MVSTRKMRNLNKSNAKINEDCSDKDATVVHKSKVRDGCDSDHESNDSPKTSMKPQKRGRAKLQPAKTSDTPYPDLLQSQLASSSYGCLSLLKKKRSGDLFVGSMPHAVGKRTPRVPVASMYHRNDKICPANTQAKSDGTNGDDKGAHVAVLALAAPQASQIPGRSSDHESSVLDALHTLADRSVNILQPSSNAKTESSAHIKGSKGNESNEKPSVPAAVPLFEKNVNSRKRKKIKRLSEIASSEMVTRKSARLMKDPDHDGSTISEVEEHDPHSYGSAISEVEAMDNVGTENASTQKSDSMSKARSGQKLRILKALAPECKPSAGADESCDNVTYPVNSVIDLKDKLSDCLSSRIPRRWFMSEWCCTAMDYPWFLKSDFFTEYPNHVKLGHESAKEYPNHVKLGLGTKLIRVEWGVIRSSFGKPRRFSKQFLHEEREKLSKHRESVGQHYADLRSDVPESLPTDLARPLAVGQHAIACHPKTRELQDGSVLTVDRNHCRVLRIDGSELKRGFEFVMGTNMQREVTHLRWKIMCEVSSSRVNMRDIPDYLLANEW